MLRVSWLKTLCDVEDRSVDPACAFVTSNSRATPSNQVILMHVKDLQLALVIARLVEVRDAVATTATPSAEARGSSRGFGGGFGGGLGGGFSGG